MEKNQIYKAFLQENYQIEERLKRFKQEIDVNLTNYISKAELQNILNQITATTAEDGTISLNIPTIS